MKVDKRREILSNLVNKYLEGTASIEEKEFIEKYYDFFNHKEALSTRLSEGEKLAIEKRMKENIHKKIEPQLEKPIVRILQNTYVRMSAAVALIFIVLGLSFLLFYPQNDEGWANNETKAVDIEPGESKAVLTLPNGETIALNKAQTGILLRDKNIQVVSDSGELLYKQEYAGKEKNQTTHKESYHTLTTPASGNYQVVLSDGTKVWLNAASSLRFPTVFRDEVRKVEVKGEVYFEVKEDATHPFVVQIDDSKGQDIGLIKVLGTHFNVNAYMDDPIVKTTLVEGSVQIVKGISKKLLKPGEQGLLNQSKNEIKVAQVNTEEAVAWKNDLFLFDDTDMVSIMNQISRWYDVRILYENKPEGRYSGIISRHTKLSEVLKILEAGGAHFEVRGKEIIVHS